MKCTFCSNNKNIPVNKNDIKEHLVITKDSKQHFHVHGPVENSELMKEFISRAQEEANIEQPVSSAIPTQLTSKYTSSVESQPTTNERKIVFKHGRAIGDALMFSCGVRDFKLLFPQIKINVENNFDAIWENNPYIDRNIKKGDPGVEFYKVGYPIINNCNNSFMHFTSGFLYNMIAVADAHERLPMSIGEFTAVFSGGEVGDYDLGKADGEIEGPNVLAKLKEKYGTRRHKGGLTFLPPELQTVFGNQDKFNTVFGRQRADLHLTEKEKSYNMIKDVYGDDIKYWVISPGGKTDCTCKIWDWRKFQDVVDHFDGLIKFVVIGKSDHIVEKLKGVIDLTDKFNGDVRSLIPLVYHAEGCVSGVSFLMHLAAGVPARFKQERKPCVAIYGGREPTAFTAYCNHQVLHTNGAFTCCDNGGCWHSRVIPLTTNPSRNTRFCNLPIEVEGKTVPSCMNAITAEDVIRGVEKYYDGNIYTYMKPAPPKKKVVSTPVMELPTLSGKEINVLASLSSKGGGEQSACKIVELLRKAGWKVNFHPWDSVHESYDKEKYGISNHSFKGDMQANMVAGAPLLFYANDQIGAFCKDSESIVAKSSAVIVGINYINSDLPKCRWLDKTNKLKAVIFQNTEKKSEFERDRLGFEDTKQIVLFGAIELAKYLEVCPKKREKNDPFVILKHCVADGRKYVTEESVKRGDKIHLWQKKFDKELDTKFYSRLLKDTKNTRFEFMEAHKELRDHFKGSSRMVFHKWNSMDVGEFLSRGHIYLYRTSNQWRDQYPRVVAEALAVGLPVLTEPRDGTKDRVDHAKTGFYCVHYDEFLLNVKTLQRKTDLCFEMGDAAKKWAKTNLDPEKWVEVIEEVVQV